MRRIVDWSVGDCEWMHYICARVEIAQAKENTAAKKERKSTCANYQIFELHFGSSPRDTIMGRSQGLGTRLAPPLQLFST